MLISTFECAKLQIISIVCEKIFFFKKISKINGWLRQIKKSDNPFACVCQNSYLCSQILRSKFLTARKVFQCVSMNSDFAKMEIPAAVVMKGMSGRREVGKLLKN